MLSKFHSSFILSELFRYAGDVDDFVDKNVDDLNAKTGHPLPD
jgi:hypothetical protein